MLWADSHFDIGSLPSLRHVLHLGASYGKQSVPVLQGAQIRFWRPGGPLRARHGRPGHAFGDVQKSWLSGNNSQIVPTETQKNTCYAIALQHEFDCPEDYATILGKDFSDAASALGQNRNFYSSTPVGSRENNSGCRAQPRLHNLS